MKKIYSIFAFALLMMLSLESNAQKTFSEKELKVIDQKVNDLMALYIQYCGFASESDLNSLSEEYITGFEELFPSIKAEIVNDLDYEKKTPKKISVEQYIKYVREWYPVGLITTLKDLKKTNRHYADQKNLYSVKATKEVKGLYKNQATQKYKNDQLFTIEFDDLLTTFKIQRIDEPGGSDSCNIYRKEGDDLLKKKAYALARDKYDKARKYCPSDPLVLAGIEKCKSILEKQKPVFLQIHLAPGMAGVNVSENSIGSSAKTASEFGFIAGVGMEAGLVKSTKGLLSIGISLDYASYSSNTTIDVLDGSTPLSDIDIDNYNLLYNIQLLNEEDNLGYFQIPVYLKYSLQLSKTISLYGKVGASFGINISKKYKITGNGEFSGQYGLYNNIILWSNALESYGFGNYAVNVKGTNSFVNSMNISAFAGLGVNFAMSKTTDLFIGAGYNFGISDIAKPGGETYYVSGGRNTMNSIFGMSKANINMLNLEVGVNLKVFNY